MPRPYPASAISKLYNILTGVLHHPGAGPAGSRPTAAIPFLLGDCEPDLDYLNNNNHPHARPRHHYLSLLCPLRPGDHGHSSNHDRGDVHDNRGNDDYIQFRDVDPLPAEHVRARHPQEEFKEESRRLKTSNIIYIPFFMAKMTKMTFHNLNNLL